MGSFLVLIVSLGWFFSYYYGNPAILYAAVIFSIIANFGSYWWSDKIVLALTRARPADEIEYQELHRLVENLAITAGLPKPRLFVVDDPAPNAFATGRDANHAAVAVTTGLLGTLERSELEGVIAHELSHIGNRDILISTIVVVLVGFVSIASDFFLRTARFGGRRGSRGGGQIQAVFFFLGVFFVILAPIVAQLIRLAISRKREFLADASGALLTRYPEGLAGALRKISLYDGRMLYAHHATAHLFIANPFGSRRVLGFLDRIFSTHPPIEERVAALLGQRAGL